LHGRRTIGFYPPRSNRLPALDELALCDGWDRVMSNSGTKERTADMSCDFGCPVAALKEATPGPVKGATRVDEADKRKRGRLGVSVGPARVIASNRAEWHRCQRGCISIVVGVSDGSYLLTSSSNAISRRKGTVSCRAVGTRPPVWSATGFFYGLPEGGPWERKEGVG
jgi:hypothetical protein